MSIKLYLASLLQPENFGPGRLIAITNSKFKPKNYQIDFRYKPFIPTLDLTNNYLEQKITNPDLASVNFVTGYSAQLEKFSTDILQEAQKNDKFIFDLLPFQAGDTLVSWERDFRNNYRKTLAEYLIKLGFEVESH